jgi:ATP-dependent helicase HrpA
MRRGVTRLMRLVLKEQMKQLEKSLKGLDQAALQLRGVANVEQWREDVLAAITDRAFIGDDELPRTPKAFEAQIKRARTRLPAVTEGACRLLTAIAAEFHQLSLVLTAAKGALARPAADIKAQLARLLHPGCFSETPWEQLTHLPRYLQAMSRRLEKFPRDPVRDAKHMASLAEWWQRYHQALDKQRKAGVVDPRLTEMRWQLEELRVSLFAQELKTPYPVSYKRLEKFWNSLKA